MTPGPLRLRLRAPALLAAAWLLAPSATAIAQDDVPADTTSAEEPAPVAAIPVAETEREAPRDTTVLDTIEVTATKRVKSQRDIAGSVGAIRGDDLERIRAQGLEDYAKLIPGLAVADYGSGRQIPVIRGIASSTGGVGSQFTGLTTGIYLDDMPFSDLFLPLSVPDLHPFDLERVEVLKGPQGTLFGSGALAGAIRYIVQKPNLNVWQVKASTTLAQTQFADDFSKIGALALNAPLGDTAALRLVGVARDDAGFYDSLPNGNNRRSEQDVNRLDQFTARALASWQPTDRLALSGFYFSQDTEQPDGGSASQPQRPERNDTPFPGPDETGFSGGNLLASYDFDRLRVLYTGNLLDKDSFSRGRLEPSFPTIFGNQQSAAWYNQIIGEVKGYTHELRLTSPAGGDGWLEWLVGAAYLDYQQRIFQFTPNPGPAGTGYYANPPEQPGDVRETDQVSSFLWATIAGDGTEEALFGEATGRIGEHWEVTAGARQFKTHLVADTVLTGAQIVGLGQLENPGQVYSRNHYVAEETGFNPKFALRYLHNRNMQVFALAAKGFQFGGFQVNPPIAGVRQQSESRGFQFGPYKSSTLWNYEVGLRTEWLDRRLRFDLTAFYLDWTDLQLTVRIPINPVPIPAPPGSGIPENVDIGVIVNVGAAHSEGVEASLEVLPFSGARFTSSAAWISALTDEPFDLDHPEGPVPAGRRLPGTPHFHWVNAFDYERTLPYFTAWSGSLGVTHSHIGTSPDDIRPTLNVGGYDTLDARLGLRRLGAAAYWPELGLGVNNITDVRGVSAYAGDGDAVNAFFFIRPRTTLLSLSWSF